MCVCVCVNQCDQRQQPVRLQWVRVDKDQDVEGKKYRMQLIVIICQLPEPINIKMCTAMIYEYKCVIIHNHSPTSTPPQKHTMPEDRFLTNVLLYLTLGQAVRQAIEWNPFLEARVINSSAMLCAADFVEVPTPRTRTLSLKFYTKESPPPHSRIHISKSLFCAFKLRRSDQTFLFQHLACNIFIIQQEQCGRQLGHTLYTKYPHFAKSCHFQYTTKARR